ncbi:MAG: EF-hand domain-containing protein [Proteobacteria bacterium]|nr:EF-hand domain-containing protein [Pseudomonadota bacterium]
MISTSYGAAGSSTAALSQMRQQLFAKIDTDKDGGIDKAEFLKGAGVSSTDSTKEKLATQLFENFDSDSDGKLSQDELETGFQKLSDAMRATLIQQQEASRPQPPSSEDMFAKLDSNSDGGVDEAEFIAGAPQDGRGPSESQLKEMFASFDSDGDGSLTSDELETGFKSHQPDGPPPNGGPGGPGGPPPSAASDEDDDDEADALLAMLQKSTESSASGSVNKEDLASILESFFKLQQGQVSQSYTATA